MNEVCTSCKSDFSDSDLLVALLNKISPTVQERSYEIPRPAQCPNCRERQRMAFRNERKLYRRLCSQSGKEVISVYSPDKPFPVYAAEIWWSDAFDPSAYGREIDFSRPFFPQFHELSLSVPKPAIHNAKSENCAYTNYSAENKNCYLLVGGLGAEDCYYSYRIFYSKDVVDSYDLYRCELCYECLEGVGLYNCRNCSNCSNSSGLDSCIDCANCTDCFGCVNLYGKSNHIFNEPYDKVSYENELAGLRADPSRTQCLLSELFNNSVHRGLHRLNVENCRGDQLINCKNCYDCFTLKNSEDCAFCKIGENNQDCVDANFFDNCKLQYFCTNLEKNYRNAFCVLAWYTSDVWYSMSCFNSRNLFGCAGMKRNEYCILNKQYSPEEYERTLAKIILHMVQTGEWGNFFPMEISPFAYNETIAAEHHPLSKESARALGSAWMSEENVEARTSPSKDPALASCRNCQKAFRLLSQEHSFYQKMSLAIPSQCPDCRHQARMNRRNPPKLRRTVCHSCKAATDTSSHADRVLCEQCYGQLTR